MTVPSTFDEATLDACHTDNPDDFVVGCAINLSGTFAKNYVNRFYSGKMELKHLMLLANKQYLYGEVFFPVESGPSKVLVSPVIADVDGEAQVSEELTYYNCFVPTPVMMLSEYRQHFEPSVDGLVLPEAAYGSSAVYSYVKGTIGGFSP